MSKRISLALISMLAFCPNSATAVGEDNARLQFLLQRARVRSAQYHEQTSPASNEPFIPQRPKAEIAPAPPPPTLIPEAIEHHQTVHQEQEHVQSAPSLTAPSPAILEEQQSPTTHHADAYHQDRAPRVLETHPHEEASPPSQQVHPAPAPIVHKREPKVHVQTENKVSQPPVQTIASPAPSAIQTQVQTNSHIETSQKTRHESESQTLTTHSPSQSHDATSHEETATEHSTYDEVTSYLNSILSGQSTSEAAPTIELSEQESSTINTEPVIEEPVVEPETIVEEVEPTEPIPAAPALEDEPVETLATTPSEEELTKENSQAVNLSDKENDYLLIIRKSLKSLEDDPWVKVKNNMDEAIAYFENERKLGTSEAVDVYQKIVLACKRFSEGGLELDEGDFADFEEAEALYLDTQELLIQAKKKVQGKTDYKNTQINGIIDALLGYTEEELQYIEEMLGM